MKFLSVAEVAKKWNMSERSVRNYCAEGKVVGAFLSGKTWRIPEDAAKPERAKLVASVLSRIIAEKNSALHGGIYHKVQIEFTYNSNHIEGSRLTHDQTRYIFETNTVGIDGKIHVDDIVEAVNHFKCIDMILESAHKKLTENFIKELHRVLKNGTSDSRKSWLAVGEYKKLPNEIGGKPTARPENVSTEIKKLLTAYSETKTKTLDDVLDFHYRFERIHPFQDGNGRIGRLILFKECLKNNIVPFIIDDELKLYYYRGLSEWENERGYLRETCLAAQDKFKAWLDYFKINY